MEEGFYTDEYNKKQALKKIEDRLMELREELHPSGDYSTGRPHKEIEEEMATLTAEQEEVLKTLPDEETH
ncbi:MAG: hypothetical protein V4436_01050 [Patescibacteria group bacterium]